MNIITKEWVLTPIIFHDTELKDYDFKGKVDFSFTPNFVYNVNHGFVVDPDIKPSNTVEKVIINGEEIQLKNEEIKVAECKRVQLSKNYSLQDFFNENVDAKCIVFCLTQFGSVFHEGYTIRVLIDKTI